MRMARPGATAFAMTARRDEEADQTERHPSGHVPGRLQMAQRIEEQQRGGWIEVVSANIWDQLAIEVGIPPFAPGDG